jgi:hypothetical protein
MVKVGGRVSWIAWPAMLGCVAVIVVLFVLAIPGIPGAIDFVGSTLRASTSAPVADGDESAPAEAPRECRELYPDRLWVDLTWTPSARLSPDTSVPAVDPALVTALSPAVRFTCTWRTDDGRTIQSTLADVAAGSAPIAQAALSASGASCTVEGDRMHCEHESDGVTRIDDIQGELWLSSTLTQWTPDDYAAQTAAQAFGR